MKAFRVVKPPLHTPEWYKIKRKRHKVYTACLMLAAAAAVVVPAEIAHFCYTSETLIAVLTLWEPEA